MPRFAILRHETPPDYGRPTHWDLMLEMGNVLRTWALEHEPDSQAVIVAESLPDHRLDYLSYEGPVSRNRGWVTRWDSGDYEIVDESPHRLRIKFDGARIQGLAVLQTSDAAAAPVQRWTFSLYFT